MVSELTTHEVNGTTIYESPRGVQYHLIYDDEGLIHLLYRGDFSISTTKNMVCSVDASDIEDAIDANVLFYDDRSEVDHDCLNEFFG